MICVKLSTLAIILYFNNAAGFTDYYLERSNKKENVKIVRNKRTAKVIEAPVFAGMKATRNFLKHAKLIFTTGAQRIYKKPGGLQQALLDLKAAKPPRVLKIEGGLLSKIGGRKIIISNRGWAGKPTVNIFSQETNRLDSDGSITSIVYTD